MPRIEALVCRPLRAHEEIQPLLSPSNFVSFSFVSLMYAVDQMPVFSRI